MSTTMEQLEIIRNFSRGINCSQLVVKQWAEKLGLDEETALCMAAPFGGGCMGGNICGCVTSSLMMLGLENGFCESGDSNTNKIAAKVEVFRERFVEKHGSLICRDLIGYDYSNKEERTQAVESGVVFKRCPTYVNCALEILDDMIG